MTKEIYRGSLECELQLEVFKLQKELKIANKKLEEANEINKKVKNDLEELENSVKHIFTEDQIKKMKNKKQVKWNIDDISSAISLYSAGPRSYKYLYKKGHPLPGLSTLREWAKKINVKPGILTAVLKLMKQINYNQFEKICILSFDEMKIRSGYEYDKANDTLLSPSNYVQVVLARGLMQKWKQPVYYNYDCNMTASILNNIIEQLYSVGYMVVAVVSDMGPGNQSVWKQLSIGIMKTWFPHPVKENARVYVFADVPHLIKLIRNHFIDSGFIINNRLINTDPIKKMLEITDTSDLKISYKITDEHLAVQNVARQNVKLATQLFSHTVSCCLKRCVQLGKMSETAIDCADFIKLINDWFDVFNSKIPAVDMRNRKKAFGLAISEQEEILKKTDEVILELRTPGKKSMLPFQKGILISNESLRGLYKYLKSNYNFEYILTNRLNQDVLENFFIHIRSKGGLHDHPSALEFKYRLRSYLLGNVNMTFY